MIEVVRERHETPAWAQNPLTQAGGLIPVGFGERPLFRVVWGWNRFSWIGGKWDMHDSNGNWIGEEYAVLWLPKYMAFDENGNVTFSRWMVEKWQPPELYGSPRDWKRRTASDASEGYLEQLGPYPSRGEYELCYIIQTPKREFVQITPTMMRHVAGMIQYGFMQPKSKRLAAQDARHEKREADELNRGMDILSDVSPFFKGSYVSFAGLGLPN